jgi:glutamine synthetase
MHCNFSNELLRTCGDKATYDKICKAFGSDEAKRRHIEVYGEDNHRRLTGKHETASIHEFSYGISDRGASIRIPIATVESGYKGYLEDRRPASNADPYKVAAAIIDTVKSVK